MFYMDLLLAAAFLAALGSLFGSNRPTSPA
jgi:hypothetical protein